MNGNFHGPGNGAGRSDEDKDDGLDPELTSMFDSAAAAPDSDAAGAIFVSSMLSRMQRARRLRLVGQVAGMTVFLGLSAFVAPYVAQQTFRVADALTERLAATDVALVYPIGCFLALIAWRMARRARTY